MKTQIIEQLGQTDVLLPALIAQGLAANDRVKVRLSILQAAGRHARDPKGARFDLTGECHAAGIDPLAVETLVSVCGDWSVRHRIAVGLIGCRFSGRA